MNVEETITTVTRMPSVQILLAPINASALQDILVMAWLAQVLVDALILFPEIETSTLMNNISILKVARLDFFGGIPPKFEH